MVTQKKWVGSLLPSSVWEVLSQLLREKSHQSFPPAVNPESHSDDQHDGKRHGCNSNMNSMGIISCFLCGCKARHTHRNCVVLPTWQRPMARELSVLIKDPSVTQKLTTGQSRESLWSSQSEWNGRSHVAPQKEQKGNIMGEGMGEL